MKILIKHAKKKPKEIINGYTEIKDEKLFFSSSIPKLVFDKKGYLLYISRGPIPSNKALEFKKLGDRFVHILFQERHYLILVKLKTKHL